MNNMLQYPSYAVSVMQQQKDIKVLTISGS